MTFPGEDSGDERLSKSALVAVFVASAFLFACAASPHVYSAPDSTRLRASTTRVSVAVDAAHANARKAREKVNEARKRQKEIAEETKKLKDVPVSLIEKINEQDSTLEQAAAHQTDLEKNFVEANAAKAQVEKDKADYFMAAQRLADDATRREIKAAAAINRYHSLKWKLCFAIAALVGFIVFQFKAVFLVLGPWGWGAMAALPIGAFALAWIFF